MKKLKKPRRKVNPSKPLNGETLQAAVSWAINREIFSGLKIHGNTVWQMAELVVLAVIWVWSDQNMPRRRINFPIARTFVPARGTCLIEG